MDRKRKAGNVFLAALAALLAWAAVTGTTARILSDPRPAEDLPPRAETVLFDERHDVLPAEEPVRPVFEPVKEPVRRSKVFEFAITQDYFNSLLETHADRIPVRNARAIFEKEAIRVIGDVPAATVAEEARIPSAARLFLPETLPCALICVPCAEEGKVRVRIRAAECENPLFQPFLSRDTTLQAVEDYLNGLVEKYVPSSYQMEYVGLTDSGIYVRFRTEE